MTRRWPLMAALCAALVCMCGCQKELVWPGGSVKTLHVAFMWEEDELESGKEPDGMMLYFFPLGETGQRWVFNIPSAEGGEVELPTGEYQVLARNADTRYIDYTHTDSYDSFAATTLTASGATASIPDELYGAAIGRLRVTECGIEYLLPDGAEKSCGQYLMRMWPRRLTARYNVYAEECEGLSDVRSVRASLSGMACGCLLSAGDPLAPAVDMGFGMSVTSDSEAQGSFLNFRAFPGDVQTLELTFTLADGRGVRWRTDVSDQIANSPTPGNVDIRVKGIIIPPEGEDPIGGDTGLDVGVDGWDVVIIDLTTDVGSR